MKEDVTPPLFCGGNVIHTELHNMWQGKCPAGCAIPSLRSVPEYCCAYRRLSTVGQSTTAQRAAR